MSFALRFSTLEKASRECFTQVEMSRLIFKLYLQPHLNYSSPRWLEGKFTYCSIHPITERILYFRRALPPNNELVLFGFFRSLFRTLFSSPKLCPPKTTQTTSIGRLLCVMNRSGDATRVRRSDFPVFKGPRTVLK